ncbi:hypothetical protein E3Q13_02567 [Wallemia mellicola]|nr:hypothetical protein E3Q13_02567 [Wallemia mellicola]
MFNCLATTYKFTLSSEMQLKQLALLTLTTAVLAQGPQGGGTDILKGLDNQLEIPEGSLKNQTLSEPPAWATSKAQKATSTSTSATGARPVETGLPDEAKKQIKQAKEDNKKDDKEGAKEDAKPAEGPSKPKPTGSPKQTQEAPKEKSDDEKLLGGGLLKRGEDKKGKKGKDNKLLNGDLLNNGDKKGKHDKLHDGDLLKRQGGGSGSNANPLGGLGKLLGQRGYVVKRDI